MADNDLRTWSFLSLLVGGILIAVGGLMGALMMGYGPLGVMPMGAMMGGYVDEGWAAQMAWWMGLVGLATGAFVLLAAYNVRQGRSTAAWSVVAIVAGALSLFAMGGYVVGAVAAIAGGALGLLGTQKDAARSGGA